MGKRQESAENTRRALIASAKKLISERGLDGICVEDITRDAGVSKGSFYTYFDSKEDIVASVSYDDFDRFWKGASGDPEARLRAFLMGSIGYIKESGLRMCQTWCGCSVSPQDGFGKAKAAYDLEALTEIAGDAAIAEAILQEYYGIVFLWAVTDGSIDPVARMGSFCDGPMLEMLRG